MVCLVTFVDDPGWHHERLLLYPVTSRRWVVLTADGDLYDEDLDWYSSLTDVSGVPYPEGVFRVVAFSLPLEDDEVLGYVKDGRAEARRVRALEGIRTAVAEPRVWVNWDGEEAELRGETLLDGVRRRLRVKTQEAVRPEAPRAVEDAPGGRAPAAALQSNAATHAEVDLEAGPPLPPPWSEPPRATPRSGDHLWILCDPGHPAFGESRGIEVLDSTAEYVLSVHGNEMVPWRRVDTKDVASFRARCLANLRGYAGAGNLDVNPETPDATNTERGAAATGAPAVAAGAVDPVSTLRDRLREPAGEKAEKEEEEDDIRTLAVDYDEHGLRWKKWRDVVGEAKQLKFDDWSRHVPEGTPIAQDMLINFERIGGDPRRWLQEWLRDRGLNNRERTAIEMKVLVDAVYFAGCYDQLNLSSLLFVEVLLRRAAQIIEAYDGDPSRPNWTGVRFMMGETHALNPVPYQMRAFNARKLKEETEIENARKKAAPTGGAGDTTPAAAGEGGSEQKPGGGPATARTRNTRTRKLAAAAEG